VVGKLKCRLQALRTERGVSFGDLEKLTGISKGSLFRIERGGDIQLTTAHKIAAAFDVEASYIWPEPVTFYSRRENDGRRAS